MAPVYRVDNPSRGLGDINDRLDESRVYQWTMLGADGIGLYGAAGGMKGLNATAKALRSAGVSGGDLAARAVPAAVRTDLSLMLGAGGMKLGSRAINRLVRQRLLDGAGGVLGVVGSAVGGLFANWSFGSSRRNSRCC